MFGKGLLKGLGITFKHTFEREITQQYPEQHPYLHDRYRGCLAYDFPKCIACGLCIKACPNNVLTLDTFKDEGSKKKKVSLYSIDLQYCLFCNLCVEVCPTDALYFTHDFELTTRNRDDIKIVYHRPPELDLVPEEKKTEVSGTGSEPLAISEADAKRLKQIEAIKNVLAKNPAKTLSKLLASEEDTAIMITLLKTDEKKLSKLAELIVDDKDKATKLAQAWVNKDKKDKAGKGGGQ